MASNVIQSTLQLLGVPCDINEETVIKIIKKYGGELVQVKRVRMLSDDVGSTLVTITATEKDIEDFLKQFPVQFDMKQVAMGKMWHHTSERPTVILENPPVEVHVQDINNYMEKIEINATTTVSQNSVLITLNDPSDLPYLVTNCHTVNDHSIVFKEISSQNPKNLTSDTQNGTVLQHTQKSTAIDIPRNHKDSVLHIKDLPEDTNSLSIKTSFKELFQEGGHTMTEFIHVQHENVAYVKFKDENSIPQLFSSPPDSSTLLGHPIKYSIIEESKVKTPNDHVLVVDGLPSCISDIDQSLCTYLKNTTKVQSIKSCKVVQQKAFVEYESPEDVQKIVQSPPPVPFFQKSLQFTQSIECFSTGPGPEIVTAETLFPPLSEAEDQLVVNQGKWQLILKHRSVTTLDTIEREASKMKVKLTFPNADNSSDVIRICGNKTSVQNIKRQLTELLNKVFITDFLVSPLNLHELVKDGTIKAESQQLEKKHTILVSYDICELPSRLKSSVNDPTTPTLLVKATSRAGSRVAVYSGGTFSYVKCDVIACFISTTPNVDDLVLLPLMSAGGSELQHEVNSYLQSKCELLPATVHKISTVGSLNCKAVYLTVLPCYNDDLKSLVAKPQSYLVTAINVLITEAIRYGTDIVIAPISCAPLNYPTELFAEVLIQVLTDRNSEAQSDLNFSIFVENSSCEAIFKSKMREYDYHIHYQHLPHLFQSPCEPVNHIHNQHLPHLSQSPSELSSVTVEQLKKTVKVTQGDMMSIQADVYINSTNPEFDLSKGELSRKLKRLCGRKLIDEAREYIQKSGKLKPGQVAMTSANKTKAKCLFHIALLRYIEKDSLKTFRETVKTIFRKVIENGYSSIAIPCLGSVGLGYPALETAKIVFEEIITFLSENPQTIIHFHIVLFRTLHFNAYAKEFDCSLKRQDFIELVKKHLNPNLYKVQDKMRLEDLRSGKQPKNHLIVKLCNGSIVDEETNVIVTNTSDDMRPDSKRISKAIHDAGGQEFMITYQSLLANGAKFVKGIVIPINACGKLRCNKVYHVQLPGKMKGISPNQAQNCFFEDYIYNCLQLAENEKQRSISFPAFCVGSGNYTISESAEPTFNAIRKFTTINSMHLREVHVVISDQKLYDAFYFQFRQTFPSANEKSNELTVSLRLQSDILPHFPGHLCKTPSLRECKLSFRICSFNENTLIEAKRELIASINKRIVDDMVDLGETAFLLNESIVDEIIELAEERNIDVKFQQSLNRILVSGVETSVKIVCQHIQKKVNELSHLANQLRPYEWSSKHKDGTIALYTLDITMQLELAYQREQSEVQVVIDGIQCNMDLKAMEEHRDGGVTRTIKRNVKIEDYPPEWDHDAMTSKVVHYVNISTKSSEYKKATTLFLETLGESRHKYEIVKVQRVQNPAEYMRYQSVKRTWLSQGSVKEKELFHGTKKDNIESICSTGFNRSFAAESNAANFGKGVYFALNSRYSLQDKYSAIDSDGYKHILVCSVLVCNITRGKGDMNVSPPLKENPQIVYDTLVDDESKPTIFVAMRDSQAYTNYWITVKM